MKKLVVLMPNLKMGGAQRSLLYMLTELDKSKIDVVLILFDKEGELISELPDGIKTLYFENYYDYFLKKYNDSFLLNILISILKFDFKYLYKFIFSNLKYKFCANIHEEQKIWFAVKNFIKKIKIDADFCISYMQGTATYYLVDKVVTNGKKVAMLNTDYSKAGYSNIYDQSYYEKLDNVICYTDEHNDKLAQIFPDMKQKIITIENITSITCVKNYANHPCILSQIKDVIKIVSVGRLEVNIKGYDLVVSVANRLSNEGYDFKWYILGEGSGRAWLEEKIKEYSLQSKLILLGNIINPYPYIKNADFVVQASRFEGKCRAIPESNVLQTPIICTEFAQEYAEIINGFNAYICNTNADSLYQHVKKLIDDPKEIARLRKNIIPKNESGIKYYHDFFEI